ncbi:MAG: 4-alpha-glucanotransferase [Rhodospirillum sp.]|nr:4-alpha-glucanotransferase [Rhodospirillum sp.]MCF8487766.1 4-alpha-glucanotransferase [Rhodospirillum sp.]MCF8501107.1 4-alpha-glucanotransferase [Rhodospirillum sp.]
MTTPDHALRAGLAALGYSLGDGEEGIAEVLAKIEDETWVSPLPPCLVHVLTGDPISVPLTWPEAVGRGHWTILPEAGSGGAEETGFFDLEALTILEQGEDGRARRLLDIPLAPKPGYHRLRVVAPGRDAVEVPLIVAPTACWLPEGWAAEDGPRIWGLSVQVHGLRSENDWGMGDLGALATLARTVGRQGGDTLGINPLHALFRARPGHASPYSPNSRLFLNPLYIAISDVPEFPDAQGHLALDGGLSALREPDHIDMEGVATHKWAALEALFQVFAAKHLGRRTTRGRAFAAFVNQGGEPLRRFALFEALSEVHGQNGAWSWRNWPEAFHDAGSVPSATFAEEKAERLAFYQWCQFEADRQLSLVAEACARSGQALGLYRDLALGADPTGADSWILGDLVAMGMSVGAPPDPLNAKGQNWGFPPFHPARLRAQGYQPFVDLIRANMRHAGALRIDHVLGLMRLFCVPDGLEGCEGFYLGMPMEDLIGILALESHRQGCLVIGEDLGTVPDGFRDRMTEAGILSYRLFYFERGENGALTPPEAYPRLAMVAASTHDLPTLCGYWDGRDLAWKHRLQLWPNDAARDAEGWARHGDRPRIAAALAGQGTPLTPMEGFEPPPELVPAVTQWLARAPSILALTQLEDVLEMREQANLPGTVDSHPNWRLRVPLTVEALEEDGRLTRIARIQARFGRGTEAGRY